MSKWFDIEDDDIDVDHSDKQVDIRVYSDDDGNVWASLTFEQIRDIATRIEKGE